MNLLNQAKIVFRQNLLDHNDKEIDILSDDIGKYAYVYADYVLVAKGYVWQDLVSVTEEVWAECSNKNKKLAMFIGSPVGLYVFDINAIKNHFTNIRDGHVMYNFAFKYGKKIDSGLVTSENLIKIKDNRHNFNNVYINTGII